MARKAGAVIGVVGSVIDPAYTFQAHKAQLAVQIYGADGKALSPFLPSQLSSTSSLNISPAVRVLTLLQSVSRSERNVLSFGRSWEVELSISHDSAQKFKLKIARSTLQACGSSEVHTLLPPLCVRDRHCPNKEALQGLSHALGHCEDHRPVTSVNRRRPGRGKEFQGDIPTLGTVGQRGAASHD